VVAVVVLQKGTQQKDAQQKLYNKKFEQPKKERE
jgi:hypothetical protein